MIARYFISLIIVTGIGVPSLNSAVGKTFKASGHIQEQAFDSKTGQPVYAQRNIAFEVVRTGTNFSMRLRAANEDGTVPEGSKGYTEVVGLSNTIYEVTVFEPSMLAPNSANVAASTAYMRPFPVGSPEQAAFVWLSYCSGPYLDKKGGESLLEVFPVRRKFEPHEPEVLCYWDFPGKAKDFVAALWFPEEQSTSTPRPKHKNFLFEVNTWTNLAGRNWPQEWAVERASYDYKLWTQERIYRPFVYMKARGFLKSCSVVDTVEQIRVPQLVGPTTVKDYRHWAKHPELQPLQYTIAERWLDFGSVLKLATEQGKARPNYKPIEPIPVVASPSLAQETRGLWPFIVITIFCVTAAGWWWWREKSKTNKQKGESK